MSPIEAATIIKRRIEFLDLCRIIAFLSVLIGHKFALDVIRLSESPGSHSITRHFFEILTPFIFGVVIFFCVSGYIIRSVLETETTAEFFIKRFFRIYPLYIVALIIQAILTPTEAMPTVATFILQATLLGDFFNTPYSLNGVEWTLRTEIIFYAFMGTMRTLGMFRRADMGLSLTCLAVSVLLSLLPPFPSELFKGYFSIYFPFLFIGLVVYEYEKGNISLSLLAVFVVSTLTMYCTAIEVICPQWIPYPFAALAIGVFLLLWLLRERITLPKWGRLLSYLTFPVYLFHNWLYDYILNILPTSSFSRFFAVCLLLSVCYIAYITIEKPSIKLGRHLCGRLLSARPNIQKP